MKLLLLFVFVVSQSTTIPASRLMKQVPACRTIYHVGYSNGSVHELFYIDGKLVEHELFCEALGEFHEQDCFHLVQIRNQYCHDSASRLLEGQQNLRPGVDDSGETSTNRHDIPLLKPKILAMTVPAFLLLGCALICPCLQARKRDADHTANETNSTVAVDIASSMEMKAALEKFPASLLRVPPSPSRVPASPSRVPASPSRVPPSPSRVPPSPSRVPPSPSRFSMSPKLNRIGSIHLSVKQVTRATQSFSPSLLIGAGGFGEVYKAELPDGRVVAVKRARKDNIETLHAEFKSEVELLAKTDHRNLVKLLGYIEKGDDRLIITEYVPNGNLRVHLDGLKPKTLNFYQRLEIAMDVADALTYLHSYAEKQIIHRDVKSSNVLLTEDLRAKVADFGFARIGGDSDIHTKVRGTMGYLDPEYLRTNRLTSKSDVYSFGMLLLEILTSRRPIDLARPLEERVTIKWAFRNYKKGRLLEMMDPRMNERVDEEILKKMFGLVFQCAAPRQADRPDMKTVGDQLWGIRIDYRKRKGRVDREATTTTSDQA